MMRIINSQNKHNHEALLTHMFKIRYDVFVTKLKWHLPCDHIQKIEKDEFDHDASIYILHLDDDENILGGLRLSPTMGPHMSRDIFNYLIDPPYAQPLGPTIWETSRLFSLPSQNINPLLSKQRTIILLFKEAILFALKNKIQQVVTVTDTRVERLYRSFHWPVKRLGIPKKDAENYIVMGTQDIEISTVSYFDQLLESPAPQA